MAVSFISVGLFQILLLFAAATTAAEATATDTFDVAHSIVWFGLFVCL